MGDEENIDLTITGTINVEESVLISRVREALARGTKKVDIINGFQVETDSNVDILTGPICGEITATSAVILLEVIGKNMENNIPIIAKLYKTSIPMGLWVGESFAIAFPT